MEGDLGPGTHAPTHPLLRRFTFALFCRYYRAPLPIKQLEQARGEPSLDVVPQNHSLRLVRA